MHFLNNHLPEGRNLPCFDVILPNVQEITKVSQAKFAFFHLAGVGVTGGSGGGSLGGGGGEKRPGPPMGGGGAVPSNADIKARLTAMFAGGGAHVPTAQVSAAFF